ncbi:hypothetical protein GCM10009830_49550 [Glycomyces endophyticus]|uniref:DUF885 domain-containing protein n=1 Tax=Glycomyces endophyticus TaxID=480996 RepID=A0ABN2HZA5_9ACTN
MTSPSNTPAPTEIATLSQEYLDVLLDRHPIGASLLGVEGREDRLPDHSEAGGEAYVRRLAALRARAEAVDPSALALTEQVTRTVLLQQIAAAQDQVHVRAPEYTVSDTLFSPAVETLVLLGMVGVAEQRHADGHLARLAALPDVFEAIAQRHRDGVAAGRVPVHRLTESTIAYFERILASDRIEVLADTEPAPDSGVDAVAFRAERDRLLETALRPALARYRDVLRDEVLPHTRPDERPGLTWLPGGDDYYAKLVKYHTTTGRTARELHDLGLELVGRLRDEIAETGARALRTGDADEALDRLRTDPALRWRDGDELLDAAREAIARAEAAAPAWFGRLPSQSCTVRPVPDGEAPGAPSAYYVLPALDGARPGIYFANTYEADKRDRFSAETTAFHEAVPGHHLQIALAQELTDVPLFQRIADVNAYSEGWGLYAERLADEMGLFSSDLDRLGMLSEESVRACRLVVDTGLHALGWTRAQAVEFMAANTATAPIEVETEIDRYIAAPGQALAYMVGRLEIQRLRTEAEQALGPRFDIRGFHDTVLGYGCLPMDALALVVHHWTGDQ